MESLLPGRRSGELQSQSRRGQVHVFGQRLSHNFKSFSRKMNQTPTLQFSQAGDCGGLWPNPDCRRFISLIPDHSPRDVRPEPTTALAAAPDRSGGGGGAGVAGAGGDHRLVVLSWRRFGGVWSKSRGRRQERPRSRWISIQRTGRNWPSCLGVGKKLAQRIVKSRQIDGPFGSCEDLRRVSGVGQKTFESIRPHLRCSARGGPEPVPGNGQEPP